jgi:hypothetical protein
MMRQRVAAFFSKYPKGMLAATIVVVLLSSSEYKPVDGSERRKAFSNQHAAEQAMKRKGCSSEPAKIDNKWETAPSAKRDQPKS